jgi:hypothetical protein
MTGQKSIPPPAPFLLYLISRKTKSPKTAEISRPFQGFSLKTKGYVEKCLLPITFLFSGKNFFLQTKTILGSTFFTHASPCPTLCDEKVTDLKLFTKNFKCDIFSLVCGIYLRIFDQN